MSAKRTVTSRTSGAPSSAPWVSEAARMRFVTCGERNRPSRSLFFSSAMIFWLSRARSIATAA